IRRSRERFAHARGAPDLPDARMVLLARADRRLDRRPGAIDFTEAKLGPGQVGEGERFDKEGGTLLAHEHQSAFEGSSRLMPFALQRMPDADRCPRLIDSERV